MPHGSLFLTPFQEQSIALNKTSPQLFPQKLVQKGIKYTPLESSPFSLIFRKSKKQDEHFVHLVSLLKLIVSILPAFVNKNPSLVLAGKRGLFCCEDYTIEIFLRLVSAFKPACFSSYTRRRKTKSLIMQKTNGFGNSFKLSQESQGFIFRLSFYAFSVLMSHLHSASPPKPA